MKAFKINSKPAIAFITASLSLSIKHKATRKERTKIVKALQFTIFKNRQKYNVDVLERDTFLFEAMLHLKSMEEEGDVEFIEEVQVDVEKIEKKEIPDEEAFKGIMSILAEIRANSTSSKSLQKIEEECDCPFCTQIGKVNLQKKK
jgi:hypothetical protein